MQTDQRKERMKRSCKHIDITNVDTVKPWVTDCIMRHFSRYDFKRFLLKCGTEKNLYRNALKAKTKAERTEMIDGILTSISEKAVQSIKDKKLELQPVTIRLKNDTTTGKERMIGRECVMQQALDYIAVYSAMEIFERRMVREQASSLPGRGQVYGVGIIKRWIQADNRASEYAEKHGYRYTRKCKYFCQLDIRKCYPHADKSVFLELFRKDCANDDIFWLWSELLKTYEVPVPECGIEKYTGLLIGGLPSQWACQYMLSFIYRFIRTQGRTRNGKFVPAVKHMMMFMDDMTVFGSNKAQLKKAIERTIEYTKEQLHWEIKDNWHIRDIDQFNVDTMGYVIRKDGTASIRGRTFVHARRMAIRASKSMTERRAQRIMSYKGYFDRTTSKQISLKLGLEDLYKSAGALIGEKAKEENRNENDQSTFRSAETAGDRLQDAGERIRGSVAVQRCT